MQMYTKMLFTHLGELVQFRVLYLDRSLRPKGPGTLDIVVKDSQGNIIKQWKNIVVQRGMFAEQLQLSSQPNLGDWTMEVTAQNQKETQQFGEQSHFTLDFDQ